MLVDLLAGRAAEELKFETVTTGAANDIERATQIARNMVTQYGMSDRFGLMGLSTVESQYLENRQVLNCSDVTAAAVDEEVRLIIERCYKEAKEILSENLDVMDKIAAHLIKRETITGKEFMRIYREAKGLPPEEDKTPEERELEEMHKEEAAQQTAEEPAQPDAEEQPQPAEEPEQQPAPEEPAQQPEAEQRGRFSGASADDQL